MENRKINAIIVRTIVLASIGLSYGSSVYYDSVSERIRRSSVDEIRHNAEVTGHTVSLTVKNKLESITSNLEILSGSPALNSKWLDRGLVLLTAAQSATDSFTDEYIWADEKGIVLQGVSSSFRVNPNAEGRMGADISMTDYFSIPKETSKPYLVGYTKGVDRVPRLYVSYPIIGAAGVFTDDLDPSEAASQIDQSFKGVVVASIELKSLTALVSESSASNVSTVARLLDKDGFVLLSQANPELIGKNWFSEEVQSAYYPQLVPLEQKEEVNQFNRNALATATSESIDFTRSRVQSTLVSNPLIVEGTHVMTLFTRVSHTLPATTLAILDEQRIIRHYSECSHNWRSCFCFVCFPILGIGTCVILSTKEQLN